MQSSATPEDATRSLDGVLWAVLRVLIVDDNVDVRSAISGLVRAQGHDVVAVADGPEAIEEASRCEPDVVLVDVRLGSESGIDVARTLTLTCTGLDVVLMSMNDVPPASIDLSGARSFFRKDRLANTDFDVLIQ